MISSSVSRAFHCGSPYGFGRTHILRGPVFGGWVSVPLCLLPLLPCQNLVNLVQEEYGAVNFVGMGKLSITVVTRIKAVGYWTPDHSKARRTNRVLRWA